MAFKVYDESGKCTSYRGEPSAELLASGRDVRDCHDDAWPDSHHDRMGPGAGVMAKRRDAGAWPGKALQLVSKATDPRLPEYPADAAVTAPATHRRGRQAQAEPTE